MLKPTSLTMIIAFAYGLTKQTLKGIGPACHEFIFYFKVHSSTSKTCTQLQEAFEFEELDFPDDGDNEPEATEVTYTESDSNPGGCEDQTNSACSLGYRFTQLEVDPVTHKWRVKADQVRNWQCCVRRTN